MQKIRDLFTRRRRASAPARAPTQTIGAHGIAVYGGYLASVEQDASLTDREKWRTFSTILANCPIVAASVRYYLNLIAATDWTLSPAEHPRGEELADAAEQCLLYDPITPFSRIARRGAMFRHYGFSIQEWTARKRSDGVMTLADVAPRAQLTIERWDIDPTGVVQGVWQRDPQDGREIELPRNRLVYLVDDSLSDSPTGLGTFRHAVSAARRLARYEQLEGFAFETDLRGIPVGRAPYAELKDATKRGPFTLEDAKQATSVIETFVKSHVREPALGIVLDSEVFAALDEAARPSNVPKYDLKLLQGGSTALPDTALAIERLNRELARIFGTESLLLGGGQGAFALAKDKTNQFRLVVNGALAELAHAYQRDLLGPIWKLNGWPEEAMPTLSPGDVSDRDIETTTQALRDLAQAGAPLTPDDPAIGEIRADLGLSAPDMTSIFRDAALTRDDDADDDDDLTQDDATLTQEKPT